MRRRGGSQVRSEPDSDYWEYDGTVSVGHTTGALPFYDPTDAEIEEYQREVSERQAKKLPVGFQAK